MSKKLIEKEIDRVYFDDDIDTIIEMLQGFKEKYKDCEGVRIEQESTYEGGYYHNLVVTRMETDKEYFDRTNYETKREAELKEMRLRQYETLKKEFGEY